MMLQTNPRVTQGHDRIHIAGVLGDILSLINLIHCMLFHCFPKAIILNKRSMSNGNSQCNKLCHISESLTFLVLLRDEAILL